MYTIFYSSNGLKINEIIIIKNYENKITEGWKNQKCVQICLNYIVYLFKTLISIICNKKQVFMNVHIYLKVVSYCTQFLFLYVL